MRRWISRHRPKFVQALRMTASSLTAFTLAWAFGLPQGFWVVITALIVTQSNVGGSLKAALDRFAGSLIGAVYGGAVAFAIPHDDGLSGAVALIVAVAPLSVMAAFSAGFRVAPITAIIVLFSTTGATLGPLGYAADRVLEVGLGCAVGLLVSVLVAPTRAAGSVLETAARVAQLLAEQLEALATADGRVRSDLPALAVRTRQSLARLETLVGEAERERRSRLADIPDPEPLLRTLMRLRHDMVMLRRAVGERGRGALGTGPAQAWSHAAATGAAALRHLADALSARRPPEHSDAVAGAVGAYRDAIDGMRRHETAGRLSADAPSSLIAAGFALDQFRRDLDDLAGRVRNFSLGS